MWPRVTRADRLDVTFLMLGHAGSVGAANRMIQCLLVNVTSQKLFIQNYR